MNRLNNLVFVSFNAKMKNKHKRERDMKLDVLLSKDSSKAQGWIVEDGDDGDDEDEVEPGSGLTWKMVGEASGADEMLEPRKSTRTVQYRELEEEDFDSDEEPKENDIDFDRMKKTCLKDMEEKKN